jgi:hypothetical protein
MKEKTETNPMTKVKSNPKRPLNQGAHTSTDVTKRL